jgi:geranylgeranyl pyrophosphate synthase
MVMDENKRLKEQLEDVERKIATEKYHEKVKEEVKEYKSKKGYKEAYKQLLELFLEAISDLPSRDEQQYLKELQHIKQIVKEQENEDSISALSGY